MAAETERCPHCDHAWPDHSTSFGACVDGGPELVMTPVRGSGIRVQTVPRESGQGRHWWWVARGDLQQFLDRAYGR